VERIVLWAVGFLVWLDMHWPKKEKDKKNGLVAQLHAHFLLTQHHGIGYINLHKLAADFGDNNVPLTDAAINELSKQGRIRTREEMGCAIYQILEAHKNG